MPRPQSRLARLLALLALAASVSVSALAQPTVGIRASGVYTTASTSGLSLGDDFGVGAGAFVEVPVAAAFSVVADLGYVQGGATSEIARTTPGSPDVSSETVEFRTRTHALTIAPAVSATLRTDDLEPFLFAGPRLDLKLAERTWIDGVSSRSDQFPDAALGLSGGAGVASGRARLDLRASTLWEVDGAIRQSALELRLGVTL